MRGRAMGMAAAGGKAGQQKQAGDKPKLDYGREAAIHGRDRHGSGSWLPHSMNMPIEIHDGITE